MRNLGIFLIGLLEIRVGRVQFFDIRDEGFGLGDHHRHRLSFFIQLLIAFDRTLDSLHGFPDLGHLKLAVQVFHRKPSIVHPVGHVLHTMPKVHVLLDETRLADFLDLRNNVFRDIVIRDSI